jgi:hypothetical protein
VFYAFSTNFAIFAPWYRVCAISFEGKLQPGGQQMAERIIEEHVHTDGGGGGAITALAVVMFLLVLLAVLYFTGTLGRMFGGTQKHEIDINVNKPGIVLQLR